MDEPKYYIERLRELHVAIRDCLSHDCTKVCDATVARVGAGDYTYTIDDTAEKAVLEFAKKWSLEYRF